MIYVHYMMILLSFSLFFYKRVEVQDIQSRNLTMNLAALREKNSEKGPLFIWWSCSIYRSMGLPPSIIGA